MKVLAKFLGAILGLLLLVIVVGVVYVQMTYDKDYSTVELPNIKASTDPEVIAQGEYLANAIAHCGHCHGIQGTFETLKHNPKGDLRGGFRLEAGPFGTFYPANITPHDETGIGKLSDGEIARAIRHGVDRNGHYAAFMALAVGNMSDSDLTALVSYLRSLPPIDNRVPPDEWGFLAKALSGVFKPRMDPPIAHVGTGTASVERGRYLAEGPAYCKGCHTQADPMNGFAFVGAPYSGEPTADPDPMDDTAEIIGGPNLTPDPDTGVTTLWTEDFFVDRFKKTGRVVKGSKMPWEAFAQMSEADLRSVYRFLRTLPATKKVTGPSWRKKGWTAPE